MQEHRYFPPAGWGRDALCRPVLLQKGLKPFGGWPAAPEGRAGLYTHPSIFDAGAGPCGFYPTAEGGRPRAGLGDQGKCKWQGDCLGTAEACSSAGMLHVPGMPGSRRTASTSASSSKETGLLSSEHICCLSPGGRCCGSGVENNRGPVIFLMRVWWRVIRRTLMLPL